VSAEGLSEAVDFAADEGFDRIYVSPPGAIEFGEFDDPGVCGLHCRVFGPEFSYVISVPFPSEDFQGG